MGNLPDVLAAVGAVLPWPGQVVPSLAAGAPPGGSWIECDGRWLPRAAHPELDEALNGAFGRTDAEFAVPDLRAGPGLGAASVPVRWWIKT